MNKRKFKKAYSLLELSIVILIISILITGALSVSVGSINNAKIKTTNDRQREVYKAIGNFLITNKRLPCPASLLKVKTVDADYGNAVVGANCSDAGVIQSGSSTNLVYGMVPSRTLGLSNDMAEDAFETKMVYIVDKNFTIASAVDPNFGVTTFSTTASTGIITVNEKPSGVTQAVTADAIVILISHGANKASGYNSNASTQNTRATDTDERDNDANEPTTFFNNTIFASSSNSDVFDDIVFFKRRNDFVEDFKAMFLIPCNGATASGSVTTSASAYYGQIVTRSTVACGVGLTQSRKCEAYGSWLNITTGCV